MTTVKEKVYSADNKGFLEQLEDNKASGGRTVALVGFAESSRDQVWQSEADEIWSVNYAYQYKLPPLTRLFELHKLEFIASIKGEKSENHLEYLKQKHDHIIYMLDPTDENPSAVKFPMDDVLEDVFENISRAGQPNPYVCSSIGYMLALAIYEGFSKIELYGIELGSETEYQYQRANAEMLIGLAMGRGIEVVIPKNTALLKAKLYHKGGQMLDREYIEKHAQLYKEYADAEQVSQKEQLEVLEKAVKGGDAEKITEERLKLSTIEFNVLLAAGAYESLNTVLENSTGLIGRQFLETHVTIYKNQMTNAIGKVNHYEGRMAVLTETGASQAMIEECLLKGNQWQFVAVGTSGASQGMANLIEALDLETELEDEIKLVNEFKAGGGIVDGNS